MKKWIASLMTLLLVSILALPVMAAPEAPVITQQPQSPNYPEYSVATYTVKATGENLKATWYLEYQGKTYNVSKTGGSVKPWEAYAGETYGAEKLDDNTFSFFFGGIEKELDGAELWCVLEDGHNDVTSQRAMVTVGNTAEPPEILEIPAQLTVKQGQEAEIRCVARSGGNGQLEFLWYETTTGQLKDIIALDRGAETSDFLFCDTSAVGTRYYVCAVSTTKGGIAYSSVVAVTVEEAPQEETAPTTEATEEGTQSETTPATAAPTQPAPAAPRQTEAAPMPWWVLVLVGLVAAGIGVGVAVILIKKK